MSPDTDTPKPLTAREQALAEATHRAAIAAERKRRWDAWLATWRAAAALPCSARLFRSVARAHQPRGKQPPKPASLRPRKPSAVLAKIRKHRFAHKEHALYASTPTRASVPLRKPSVIGRAPQPRKRRAA